MQKAKREITHFFNGIGIALSSLKPIARRHGAFGQINLFQHPELGKVFVLNGEIQHVEAWAPLYHEPLVHLAASFVTKVTDVMILGGGTLYAASEALKYKSVRRVSVFDHDPKVSEIAAEFYKHAQDCFNDPRFHIFHRDAYLSISKFRASFDLVINDGADLIVAGAKRKNSSPNLFSAMTKSLKPTGVCADVVYRHLFEKRRTIRTINQLKAKNRFALSLVFLPEYHGILHALCMWGKKESHITQWAKRPRNKEQLDWIKNPANSPCVYYTPKFLHYYLYLPCYLKDALNFRKSVF